MGQLDVYASPLPFSNQRIKARADVGDSLQQIIDKVCPGQLKKAGIGARVSINGYDIPKKHWPLVKPKEGTLINVRIVPQGGKGGKNPLATILSIAVLVAAPYLGAVYGAAVGGALGVSAAVGGALVAAGVSIVGQLLIMAIAPPPKPSNAGNAAGDPAASPTQFIEGASNALNPFGVVPICLGTNRMFPLQAARPFTEAQNNDQYARQLFTFGYGENMVLSDLKMGETPLGQFNNFEIEHRLNGDLHLPLSLYANDVFQDDYSILLKQVEGFTTRSTRANANEAVVDITFPRGLFQYYGPNRVQCRVQLEIQYSPAGLNQWSPGFNSFAAIPQRIINMESISTAFGSFVPSYSYTKNLVVLDIFNKTAFFIKGVPAASEAAAVAPPVPENLVRLSTVTLRSEILSVIPYPTFPTVILSVTDDRQPALFGTTFSSSNDFKVTGAGVWGGGIGGLDPLRIEITAGAVVGQWFDITANQTEAIRLSTRVVFPAAGTYDLRIRRISPDTNNDQIFDEVFLTAIKSIAYRSPVNLPGLCGTAMRIKATDQLNGVVDQFNALVSNSVPDYDAGTDTWIMRVTSNPASLYRYVLQGVANDRPLDDSKLDLDDIKAWHIYCQQQGYTYNRVIDYDTSVDDILRDIASAGSASPAIVDGKRTIVVDRVKEDIVSIVTPRNSWGYSGQMVYPDMPHAFRVQFRNGAKGFQQDERIVYDDGYNEDNATKFENLELQSCTNADLAYKIGRRLLATARLRPEVHTFSQDIENVVALRGDRIKFENDVPIIGVGDGRIKEVIDDGTNVLQFTIDDTINIPNGGTYYARIRLADGTQLYKQINTSMGNYSTFSFYEPFPIADAPAPGDLLYVVEVGGEVDLIITKIEPANDFAANITAVNYAPEIHSAELGPIPTFNSQITTPAEFIRPVPPILLNIQSDEEVMIRNVDGSFTPRVVITLQNNNVGEVETVVKTRRTGDTVFTNANVLEATPERLVMTGYDDRARYDIEIRYKVAQSSMLSLPLIINNYLVVGTSSLPHDVTGFNINVAGTSALLKWDQNDDIDLAFYRVKFSSVFSGAAWGTAQILEDRVYENRLTTPFQGGTYLIKAVDFAGNESANAALIITYDPGVIANAVQIIQEDPLFLGAKDNITLRDGFGIVLSDADSDGYYYFDESVDLTGVFTSFLSSAIVANGVFVNNLFDIPDIFGMVDIFGAGNNDLFAEPDLFVMADIFGIGADAWLVDLQYRITMTDPTDPDTEWGEWTSFSAGNLEFWAIEFRILLKSLATDISPLVSILRVTIDMPDRIERGDDMTVPEEGIVITYNPDFQSNPAVVITIQDADAADEIQFISKTSGGFEFCVYNSALGVNVARTFDFVASGYGRKTVG